MSIEKSWYVTYYQNAMLQLFPERVLFVLVNTKIHDVVKCQGFFMVMVFLFRGCSRTSV